MLVSTINNPPNAEACGWQVQAHKCFFTIKCDAIKNYKVTPVLNIAISR